MISLTFSLRLLLATALDVCAEKQRFDEFKIFLVSCRNLEDVKYLHQLSEDFVDTTNHQIDFWREPTPGHNATIMVPPTLLNMFKYKLDQQGLSYVIHHKNVQEMVDAGSVRTPAEEVTRRSQASRVIVDHFNYHTYDQIATYLRKLRRAYPARIQLSHLAYTTYEGRLVNLVKMTGRTRTNKPAIIIEAGIHAREWISPATALWVIEQLAKEYRANDATARLMLDKYDWYFIPVTNPDGYEHTHNNTCNRLWRKNKRYISPRCTGVDLNRNFDVMWGTIGISMNCTSDSYPGTGPFSEPETANIRDLFESLYPNVIAYLAVHSYGQFLIVPWAYSDDVLRPPNAAELDRVTLKMTEALISRHGTHYTHGTVKELIGYVVSGSSIDWALQRRANLYAMAFELRPDTDTVNFLLPASEIVPTAEEFYAGLKAMALELKEI